MDSMSAFARGEASRNKPIRVFDWDKAARLIRERQPNRAEAGLSQDWEYTGGTIYENGKPLSQDETYTYLASTWAIPELDLDGEIVQCYIMQKDSPEWDAHTFWPESALAILEEEQITNGR